MSENPLLPHAELRALRRYLQTVEDVTQRSAGKKFPKRDPSGRRLLPEFEAVLAASLLQLTTNDIVVPEPGDPVLATLLARQGKSEQERSKPELVHLGESSARSSIATGIAAGLKRSGNKSLAVIYLRSETHEPGWQESLQWAQQESLPIIFICADPTGGDALRAAAPSADRELLQWSALQMRAGSSPVPVLTVDGGDAVAMYRVMQESVLRARSGAGPVLLWAVLPQPRRPSKGAKDFKTPLARLDHYLQVRGIATANVKRSKG